MDASEKGNRRSTFEDLEAYQIAHEFRKAMYRVAAAVSLTNNIAEAHGRYHYLDQIKFLRQSRGSLQELIDDLNVCTDEHYLPDGEVAALKEEGWRVRQLIDGYVRYLRDQKNSMGTASVRETSPTCDDIEELEDDSRLSI